LHGSERAQVVWKRKRKAETRKKGKKERMRKRKPRKESSRGLKENAIVEFAALSERS
jgi:hypothetical protein